MPWPGFESFVSVRAGCSFDELRHTVLRLVAFHDLEGKIRECGFSLEPDDRVEILFHATRRALMAAVRLKRIWGEKMAGFDVLFQMEAISCHSIWFEKLFDNKE